MRIQHNITALSAANRLKANENTVAKNIEKLSSGYRINSAADDAAGLAVSEKMRKQINGLSQAEDNTKNGISLIQTAEGGLNETSAILQRMNTLAVEASNGTYKDSDRDNLQMEVNSLKTEIDRISTSTKFNEISLLDGSLSANAASVTVDPALTANITTTDAQASQKTFTVANSLYSTGADASGVYSFTLDTNGTKSTHTIELDLAKDSAAAAKFNYKIDGVAGAAQTTAAALTATVATAGDIGDALKEVLAKADWAKSFTVSGTASSGSVKLTENVAGTQATQLESISYTSVDSTGSSSGAAVVAQNQAALDSTKILNVASQIVGHSDSSVNAKSKVFTVGGREFAFTSSSDVAAVQTEVGKNVDVIGLASAGGVTAGDISTAVAEVNKVVGKDVVYQVTSATNGAPDAAVGTGLAFGTVGAAAGNGTALTFQVGAENTDDQRATLSIDNMNSDSLGLSALDISKQENATAAIDIISAASAKVSTVRAQLGALQNELEHTNNNLSTMNENLTSAESTIRDVDMTDEYVQYSKNQILSQAANSMLAQANAQPQNVLSLLKG